MNFLQVQAVMARAQLRWAWVLTMVSVMVVGVGASSAASAPRVERLPEVLARHAQVAPPVDNGSSPLDTFSAGRITFDMSGNEIAMSLPVRNPKALSKQQGRFVTEGEKGSRLAVSPTPDGAQILIALDRPNSPRRFDFGLSGEGLKLQHQRDGSVSIEGRNGWAIGTVLAPWAEDAAGNPVPTHFEVRGNVLTQVVEPTRESVFPIVADPHVKLCDLRTAVCVKLSKSETKRAHDAMFVSVGAGVSTLCGLIPSSSVYTVAAKAVCAATVAGVFYTLRGTFQKAKREGRCVELKFNALPVGLGMLRGWKVVNC